MAFDELRVHGVSGTPPRDMLYTNPITDAPEHDYTKVYRPNDTVHGLDDGARAFHWGGLTAGNRITALWIFLSPFALANVAGWVVGRRSLRATTAIRLAGLMLTAVFVTQLVNGIAILEWWVADQWSTPVGPPAAVLLAVALVFYIAGWISARSHFDKMSVGERLRMLFHPSADSMQPPYESTGKPGLRQERTQGDWTDPAVPRTEQWAADARLWEPHSLLHRLRRAHLAMGFSAVTYMVAEAYGWAATARLAMLVVPVACVIVVIGTSITPEAAWLRRTTALLTPLSLLIVAIVVLAVALSDRPGDDVWQGLEDAIFYAALGFGLAGIAAWNRKSIGALTIAGFLGASMGLALVTILDRAVRVEFRPEVTDAAAWIAVWMLRLILVLIAAIALLSCMRQAGEPRRFAACEGLDKGERRARKLSWTAQVRLRRVTSRAGTVLAVAGFTALAAVADIAISMTREGTLGPDGIVRPEWSGVVLWVAFALGAVVVAAAPLARLALAGKGAWVAGGVAALAFLALPAVQDWIVDKILVVAPWGISIDLRDVVDASVTVAVLIPALFFVRSVTSGLGSGESRRKTGIIWDVVSFWPRLFHPLAPPAYGPNAVTELRKEANNAVVAAKATGGEATLSAHSQGSLITALMLQQMPDHEASRLRRVVTYGSPIGLIYSDLFEATDLAEIVRRKSGHADLEWWNLWRRSDYLGGLSFAGPANEEADDNGHSSYECTRQFAAIKSGNDVPPAQPERPCGGC